VSHDILAIPALNDNYIWAIVHPEKKTAVIVDPGEAPPVIDFLDQQKLKLVGILITHHHWDHTNGIEAILQHHPASVYAPSNEKVILCDHPVKGGDTIKLSAANLQFDVMAIPGHTLGHVVYISNHWAFTGDTLFTGGCGRAFEGSPDQLYHSLVELTKLSPETRIYCGHEYTKKNLQFAALVEPENMKIAERIHNTDSRISKNLPTVPATLNEEFLTNPFLRCQEPQVQQAAAKYCGYPLADNVAVFAALRRWKDEF